jgi:hypothetical protein
MRAFLDDVSGAVTIDWVVLAAGLLILTVALVPLFFDEVEAVMNLTAGRLADHPKNIADLAPK